MTGVLVTGGTGFLGRHVLGELARVGVPASALVRSPQTWTAADWRDEVGDPRVVAGSPLQLDGLADQLTGTTTILHAAAAVRHTRAEVQDMVEFNVNGTLNMVRLAARLGARLVFVSTSGTVGCYRSPDVLADEDSPYAEKVIRRWPYYASKMQAEIRARALARSYDVELVIVRPPVLLGPGDHRHRSLKHITRVLDSELPLIPRGGMHFTDVRDVAEALVRVSLLEGPKPIYHLPGHQGPMREFLAMVSEVAGVPISPKARDVANWKLACLAPLARVVPALSDPVLIEMAACHWGMTSLHSARDLGYQPRPARQTLVDAIEWLRADRSRSLRTT